MLARELRQKYLDFFMERGHLQLPSASLVPIDALGNLDESTLFTGSGMQQFKPYFTGAATPPRPRIITVQKCLRTGDIDSVGDYSHCTFFEMLGNFSFGDYFKADVIPWTWEFLTQVCGIDGSLLHVTVFKDDTEAFDIWHNVVGLPEDRIHKLEASKNFWPANAIEEGPNGPCGPCSEIFYPVVPLEEMTHDPDLTPTERYLRDDDAGKYVEIWNNVFTQFDRSADADGNPVLTPLPKKNNDTGAGLDRIIRVIQGVSSVFQTDLFQPTLNRIAALSSKEYTGTMSPLDFAFRVVAEHTRSMVFCIADGILPSNEGQGYVLRYIIRRAIRYGKTVLGFDRPFLHEVAPELINQMGDFYTELQSNRELILKTIADEEERFRRTLDNGMRILDRLLNEAVVIKSKVLSGREAFTLHDTYGFPYRLTEELAQEQGITVDLAGFEAAMEEQRVRSRGSSQISEDVFVELSAESLFGQGSALPPTVFTGYDHTEDNATVLAIVSPNGSLNDTAQSGETVKIVLDKTPFYAESGGQIGDTGTLTGENLIVKITDTQKNALGYWLHTATITEGILKTGAAVKANVDSNRRRDIMRNHTATHLLQAALRQILGGHVHQKGSLVAPDRLRFDFTHTQPVTQDELRRIEDSVNSEALSDCPVNIYTDVPIAEAKERGAMALFGEKYGDKVRMVEIPDFSLELCGGTHIAQTSQVGLFKIVSEGGIASGVRRIEAVTGAGAYAYIKKREETLLQTASLLKSNPNDLTAATERLIAQRRELEQENKKLKAQGGAAQAAELLPQDVGGVPVVVHSFEDTDSETLLNLATATAQQLGSAIVVLASTVEGKVIFAVKVTQNLTAQGYHAGNLIREIAKMTGGGGGGRADFAQAGGRDASKLAEALMTVPDLVTAQKK